MAKYMLLTVYLYEMMGLTFSSCFFLQVTLTDGKYKLFGLLQYGISSPNLSVPL
jgi:hypothetical protein